MEVSRCSAWSVTAVVRVGRLVVTVDDDDVVVLIETNVHDRAVGLADLDLPDATALPVALDGVCRAASGRFEGRLDGAIRLGSGDAAFAVVARECDRPAGDGRRENHCSDACDQPFPHALASFSKLERRVVT